MRRHHITAAFANPARSSREKLRLAAAAETVSSITMSTPEKRISLFYTRARAHANWLGRLPPGKRLPHPTVSIGECQPFLLGAVGVESEQ
jgi:hypothetical protein